MESIEELGERWRRIFETLAAGPRRQLVGSLLETEPGRKLSLPEAANMPDYRLDPETLQLELVHDHLPMMEQARFVEWEREPLRAWRGARFEEVAAVLVAIGRDESFPQHLIDGCHFYDEHEVNT